MRSTPIPKLTRRTVKLSPGKLASTAHDDALKRLNAFFVPLALFQPDVHANRVPGAEDRVVLAKLVTAWTLAIMGFMINFPRQTRSGGASRLR